MVAAQFHGNPGSRAPSWDTSLLPLPALLRLGWRKIEDPQNTDLNLEIRNFLCTTDEKCTRGVACQSGAPGTNLPGLQPPEGVFEARWSKMQRNLANPFINSGYTCRFDPRYCPGVGAAIWRTLAPSFGTHHP